MVTAPDLEILELGMHFDAAGGGVDRYFAGLMQGLEANDARPVGAAFENRSSGLLSTVSLDGWIAKSVRSSARKNLGGLRISLGAASLGVRQRWAAIRKLGRQALGDGSRSGTDAAPCSCQIVATHFALYAWPLLRLIRPLKSCSHIVHFHGPWADESAGEGQRRWVTAAKRLLERRVYRSAKRLIVLSQAFADLLPEKYGIDPGRIRVIPGGVDLERFKTGPGGDENKAKEAARLQLERLRWPVSAEAKIILCVRRLVPRMGLENLIEAFANAAGAHPDAFLIIGGKGPLLNSLQALADRPGLRGRVLFPGFIADADLPAAYASADFSIVPSLALEGFGLVTLESLACGTPVLVTPVGGLPETVNALDSSLVLGGSTVEALTSGLHRGLTQPLPSAGQCRAYAAANFGWTEIARRVLEVYREAAATP